VQRGGEEEWEADEEEEEGEWAAWSGSRVHRLLKTLAHARRKKTPATRGGGGERRRTTTSGRGQEKGSTDAMQSWTATRTDLR